MGDRERESTCGFNQHHIHACTRARTEVNASVGERCALGPPALLVLWRCYVGAAHTPRAPPHPSTPANCSARLCFSASRKPATPERGRLHRRRVVSMLKWRISRPRARRCMSAELLTMRYKLLAVGSELVPSRLETMCATWRIPSARAWLLVASGKPGVDPPAADLTCGSGPQASPLPLCKAAPTCRSRAPALHPLCVAPALGRREGALGQGPEVLWRLCGGPPSASSGPAPRGILCECAQESHKRGAYAAAPSRGARRACRAARSTGRLCPSCL